MEDVSDTVPPVKKAKKSLSLKMSVHSDKKSEAQEKKPLLNGTGHSSSDESTDLHSESAPNTPKVVRITKTSKAAKTEQSRGRSKSPNKQVSSSEKISQCDSPSGSAEDSFHGFDTDGLTSKQDQFLKLIQKLGGPTENGNNSEVLEENSELNESEAKEEMTVDVEPGLDSDGESEHDSDEMEIDMGNDKENVAKADPLEFVGKKILSENTKDSDVEIMETDSVKSDVEKSDKIEDESNLVEPSKPETPGKGGQLKLEYCGSCSAVVDDAEEGICCDGNCERWFHLRCSGLSQAEYDELSRDENAKWACEKCSGKPPTLKPDGKPLLSVRKDLGNLTTPSPFAKRRSMNKDGTPRTPKIDVSNPAFLKPFDFGWKRELVYRSTSDSNNRRQGDIYYYTPKGKKLRSLREISEHLAGTDLTQDNFTFWKEPLGLDDPEREIIREAKLKVANKEPTSSPAQPKKIVPKITKTPKTVPKLTATVSPMESSGTTPTPVAKASASVTPRIVIKGKSSLGPKFKITPSKNNVPGQTPKLVINKGVKPTRRLRSFSNRGESIGYRSYEDVIADPRGNESTRQYDSSSNKDTQRTDVSRLRPQAIPNNSSESLVGEEMNRRNNFRRYGLLANAKTQHKPVKKFNPYTSSSSDGNSSGSGCEGDVSDGPINKMSENNISPHVGNNPTVDLQPTYSNSDDNSMFLMGRNMEDNLHRPFSMSPATTNSTTHLTSKSLILSPTRKKPSPPEIQFRPSNPSSYGCQTSPVMSCRSTGLNLANSSMATYSSSINCSSQIETVLIVEPSRDTFRRSVKSGSTGIPFQSPLILNNDGAIEIINVESLNPQQEPPESYNIASSYSNCKTDGNMSPMRNVQKTNGYNNNNYRKTTEYSPVSMASALSEEVIVLDDDLDSSNPPPFLDRNSPPQRLARNDSTASRSPPSLQPITVSTCSSNHTDQDLESPIYLSSSFSDTYAPSVNSREGGLEQHSSNTGIKHMEYRKRKEERLRKKILLKKKLMLKKKRQQQKREEMVKFDYQKKQLTVQYYELRVNMMKRKLAMLDKERSHRKLLNLFPM